MTTDPYNERVRAYFANPAHAGTIDDVIAASADDQGIRLRLYAAGEAGRIRALRFQAWGCPHVIAAAEAFCASYEGRPVGELLEFSVADLMQSLSVPLDKTGRILVLEDAVRTLGKSLCGASN